MESLPKVSGDAKFSTWMYRVALNTAITLYRKSKKRVKTQDFDSVLYKIKATDYDDTEERQLKLMYDAIKQLGDIEKALVFLYLEDKDYSEIAETLGISEVNAKSEDEQGKTKLRTILNPWLCWMNWSSWKKIGRSGKQTFPSCPMSKSIRWPRKSHRP